MTNARSRFVRSAPVEEPPVYGGLFACWVLWLRLAGPGGGDGADEGCEFFDGLDGAAGGPRWGLGVDEDLLEEGLVEQVLDVIGGSSVGGSAVLQQRQPGLDVGVAGGGVSSQGLQLLLHGCQAGGDAVLFAAKEVEGDGVGVVRLQQALLFAAESGFAVGQLLALLVLLVLGGAEVVQELGLDLGAFLGCQADAGVDLLDSGLDLWDEHAFLLAVGALVFATVAEEVGVDGAGLGVAVLDDHPGGAHVEVSDRRPARGSAGAGFLGHPFDDFVGEVAAVELGDGAHDAVQEHAAGGFVDGFGGGDQADAGVGDGCGDLDVVGAVAGQAVEFVDDDVVDVGVGGQVAQHGLEFRAAGDGASGFAFVGEFAADDGAEVSGLLPVGFALGGDGEAFFTSSASGLVAGGDP